MGFVDICFYFKMLGRFLLFLYWKVFFEFPWKNQNILIFLVFSVKIEQY